MSGILGMSDFLQMTVLLKLQSALHRYLYAVLPRLSDHRMHFLHLNCQWLHLFRHFAPVLYLLPVL